ncbi:hypothetical protein ACYZT8_27310 [Pseudomonas sp. LB3P93]
MSRSLGLREDQREGEVLATLIAVLFPVDPVCRHREQVGSPHRRRSHKGSSANTNFAHAKDPVGAGLPAMRPEQSAKI